MMKLLPALALLFTLSITAQPAPANVSQRGVEAFTATMPAMQPGRFTELTKAWANAYTGGSYDATSVTGSSITISAVKRNAFRYRNTSETVENKISYSLVMEFTSNSYTLKFLVEDIYGDNDVLLKYRLPDFYKSNGELKDGYDGLEKSLEATINDIVQSHYDYLVNYN